MGHRAAVSSPLMAVLSLMLMCDHGEALTEVNGPASPPALPLAEPQIAMFCGRPLLHMTVPSPGGPETGRWSPDPQGRQGCFTEPGQILAYCQEMYPTLQISHIEESSTPVTIPSWCTKGWGHCQTHPFIVLPYRCRVGQRSEVSEALLVPERCRFLHQEQMDSCESYIYWHNVAKEACAADGYGMELHSYGMLLPCGDHFRGVEYVCCPGRGVASSSDPAPPPRGGVEPLPPQSPAQTNADDANARTKVTVGVASPSPPGVDVEDEEEDEEDEEAMEEEEEGEEVREEEEDDEADEDDEDDEDETTVTAATAEAKEGAEPNEEEYSEYSVDSRDYLDPFYNHKGASQGRRPTLSPPLTRGDSLPTPHPTDGVDVYFEMPGDDNEHGSFLRAKMFLEERRMKRINEIMKEWAEADNQSKNLPRSDRQALNEHFQAVLQTLEMQVSEERQRLVETHLARVVATLNNNRRLALESYLTAVQTTPPQPERVLQALKRYMAAEQKDRRHTLRHYQHIEAVDPTKAEQMKFQVYTHLHVIEERMNQSLALLYKVPVLAEELHQDIQELVKEQRGDVSSLMTTSFSETRTTEELLPAESQEEKDDEEEEERAWKNRPYPVPVDPQPNKKVASAPVTDYDYPTSERGPTYEYEDKINSSVELKQLVYKTPEIQRDELQPDALETFNRGAMVGLLVVAVAIAMVMVISLLLVRRKPYGTISHGIVEVDPMLTPEERQLNKMQNHGYENPTYKFFEQMN